MTAAASGASTATLDVAAPSPKPRGRLRITSTRRPAVALALALLTGILIHPFLPMRPAHLAAPAATCVALAIVFRRHSLAASLLLVAATVITGAALARQEHFYFAKYDIAEFASDTPRLAEVEAVVTQEPRILAGAGQLRALPPKQVAAVDITRLRTWDGWIDGTGHLLLQIEQPNLRLGIGQTIRATGYLQRPWPAMNPGQFDWARYYRDQRVLVTMQCPRSADVHVLADPGPGALARLRAKVRHLLAAGFPAERATDHALLRALLLGDHDPALRDVQEQFERTGTMYQLAVSGLHVAILAAGVVLVCRLLCLRPQWTVIIAAVFVLLYGVVSLPSYSGIRSVVICAAIGLGSLRRRQADRVQLVALAAFGLLVYKPLDLYTAGFQLSFCAVLGLILLAPPLTEFIDSFANRDRLVLESFGRARVPAWRVRLTAMIRRSLIVGTIAWAVTLPLIAVHFESVNPWAAGVSLLLLPVVIAALFGGLLKVLLTLFWPGLSGLWTAGAAAPMAAVRHAVGWLGMLPGSRLPLASPGFVTVLVYYVLLLSPLLLTHVAARFAKLRWPVRGLPAVAVLLILFPVRLPNQLAPSAGQELRITLLAIGAGQTCVCELPTGDAVFFDAGSSSVSDLVRKVVDPFLRHEGRRSVRAIFLSHGDYDHISAAGDIAAAYDVSDVYLSPHLRELGLDNAPDTEMLATFSRLGLQPHTVDTGDHIELDAQTKADVLWPPKDCGFDSNNTGVVLKLTFAGRTVLFPADIQVPAMTELLKHPEVLKADVLVAAHHGSSETTTPAFVSAVDPAVVLSSNDRKLTMKQQQFETMIGPRPLYRTNRDGAVTVTITGDGKIRVDTFLSQPPTVRR